MKFSFKDLKLDLAARELTRQNAQVTIEPKALDVLIHLIEHRDRVVSKDELVDAVWRGRFTSDNALSSAIKSARQSVGDDGRSQQVIRTVHGHGFRFVAALTTPNNPSADSGAGDDGDGVGGGSDVGGAVGGNDAGDSGRGADSHSKLDSRRDQSINANPPNTPNPSKPPTNLKLRRRTLLGRSTEKNAISEHLAAYRFVSIVGPGGAGKTALAVDTAFDLLAHFPGGVWLCELAPVNAEQVESAVLGAMDSSAGAGAVNALMIAERFTEAPTLLILDNCEHVIDAAAALAEELFNLAPMLAILATSREALEVADENIIQLAGLDYDREDSVAVEMFNRCAERVTDLAATSESNRLVKQITERLEGLPLAIELAAPQLASRTPLELLNALDDQLSILSTRRRRGASRHSAMDDAIAWSYDLLDRQQQQVLAALSFFSGPFTVQAAEALFDETEVRSLLHDLVGQSMVTFAPGNRVSRFRLLEPIRQFARRQLDAEKLAVIEQRHAEWFAARGRELGSAMRGAGEIEASEALTVEWSDFGRALAWGQQHQRADIAVDPLLVLGIHLLWQNRAEAFGWLEAGVEACELSQEVRARAEIVRCMGAWREGNLERCEALIASSEAIAGETFGSVYMSFYVNFVREDFDAAVACGSRVKVLAQQSNKPVYRIMASAFYACGLAMCCGTTREIPVLLEEVESELSRYSWPSGRCCYLLARVVTAFGRGANEELVAYRHEMQVAANKCYSPWFNFAAAGMENTQNARSEDDTLHDLTMYTKNVLSAIATGDVILVPTVMRLIVIGLVDLRQYDKAAQLCGHIPKLRGLGEKGSMSPCYSQAVAKLEAHLPGDQFDALIKTGASWQLSDVGEHLETWQAELDALLQPST